MAARSNFSIELDLAATDLTLCSGQHVGKLEKERIEKVIHIVPRTANYLRFLAYLVSGLYALVLMLMPHLLRYISRYFCFDRHP
jgi:hypothetical protein